MYIEPFKPREKLGRVILSPTGPQWYLDEDACNRLNPIIRAYNRFLKMHVGGRAHKRGDGSIVVDPVPKRFWARLTNDSPSYSWVEVTPDAIGSTTWEPIAGGRAGENAREYNERSTPEGTVVWMELWDGGQERFFEDREGEAGPCTGQVCVTVERCNSGFDSGANIEVYDSEDNLIDSCVTDSNGQCCISGLVPGDYELVVETTEGRSVVRSFTMEENCSTVNMPISRVSWCSAIFNGLPSTLPGSDPWGALTFTQVSSSPKLYEATRTVSIMRRVMENACPFNGFPSLGAIGPESVGDYQIIYSLSCTTFGGNSFIGITASMEAVYRCSPFGNTIIEPLVIGTGGVPCGFSTICVEDNYTNSTFFDGDSEQMCYQTRAIEFAVDLTLAGETASSPVVVDLTGL